MIELPAQMQPAKIIVVDDFEPIREFVCSRLQRDHAYQVVGQASDGAKGIDLAERLQPDLILLDIHLPNVNGIEAARRIAVSAPRSKIVFLSQDCDPEIVEQAMDTGAYGYIIKSELNRELFPALEAVARGERFISSGLAQS